MLFIKKLGLLFCLAITIVGYNNCAGPTSEDSTDPTIIERRGNGTPYGGKLKPGEYIPTNNQYCNSNFQEKVTVTQDVNGESIELDIPCENRKELIDDSLVVATQDKDRMLYNTIGYAHESTNRAQMKDTYKVACRTTEQNFGAEVLVYGLGPVYQFENIDLNTDLTVYGTTMSFTYQDNCPNCHAFYGQNDELFVNEGESGPAVLVGRWLSTAVDSSKFSTRMSCENLDQGTPFSEW